MSHMVARARSGPTAQFRRVLSSSGRRVRVGSMQSNKTRGYVCLRDYYNLGTTSIRVITRRARNYRKGSGIYGSIRLSRRKATRKLNRFKRTRPPKCWRWTLSVRGFARRVQGFRDTGNSYSERSGEVVVSNSGLLRRRSTRSRESESCNENRARVNKLLAQSLLGQNEEAVVIKISPMKTNERMAAQQGVFLTRLFPIASFSQTLMRMMLRPETPERPVVRKFEVAGNL